jgi:hypothetical protein
MRQVLQARFELFYELNKTLERNQLNGNGTDFFQICKVDTHVHLAGAFIGRELLHFIKSKMQKEKDLIVQLVNAPSRPPLFFEGKPKQEKEEEEKGKKLKFSVCPSFPPSSFPFLHRRRVLKMACIILSQGDQGCRRQGGAAHARGHLPRAQVAQRRQLEPQPDANPRRGQHLPGDRPLERKRKTKIKQIISESRVETNESLLCWHHSPAQKIEFLKSLLPQRSRRL